jgi:UDP-galactopyranose mutase
VTSKIIVVGSGWSGAVIAREAAEKMNRRVTLIERRNHIAGNMYDERDEHNILIQRYGPHTLGTNRYDVVEYVERFGALTGHIFKVKTFVDGKYVYCPYSYQTIIDLVGIKKAAPIIEKLKGQFGDKRKVSMYEFIDNEDGEVKEFANLMFEKIYRNYVAKMWGLNPFEIDSHIVDRSPFQLEWTDRKAALDYYFMPNNGFAEIFGKMLSHPNIQIKLNCDALEHIAFDNHNNVVLYDDEPVSCIAFTGQIDELFGQKFGALPYRTLDIKYEHFESDSVLPTESVYYPQADGYTRKTESRKQMVDDTGCIGSVVATEYPRQYVKGGTDPYYPVLTDASQELFAQYKLLASRYTNLFCLGRLADFKYYDMDAAILRSLEVYENIKEYLNGLDYKT